ncbi:MAG: HDIG domain-containing metalloprotein [Bacillota bacterium]|uniref:HDIG domain-containing metalloprotein n=1 Tax=Desulfurispora thermophila TaxID=265470 RepID=UPI00036A4DEB|nr:HDIG domain-containing metalloprotein [Desulfurispora thermophila]
MQREAALDLLQKYIKTTNLVKHCLAVEAVMRGLARYFAQDEEKWGLAGLLHDIDYEQTKDDPQRHSLLGAEILEQHGLPEDVVYAVKVHNHAHGLPRLSLLDKALYCADPVTGLIVAGALIKKEKSLAAIDVPFLLNRFGEKSFARGANRQQIATCAELGLELEKFLDISLTAMQDIAREMGL